jgi:hypothetical protein
MKNYRILKPNEIVRKGDQVYDPITRGWYFADGKTAPMGIVGKAVKNLQKLALPDDSRVRRKVS